MSKSPPKPDYILYMKHSLAAVNGAIKLIYTALALISLTNYCLVRVSLFRAGPQTDFTELSF